MTNRIDYLIKLPFTVAHSIRDTAKTGVGIVASLASCLAFELIISDTDRLQLYRAAEEYAPCSRDILTPLYINILKIVNPDASLMPLNEEFYGLFTKNITSPIFNNAYTFSQSASFFQRHVVSRISYAMGGMASIITRTIEFALGAFAALFSILAFGKIQRINEFARDYLHSTEVINDVCLSIRGVVNPRQFVEFELLSFWALRIGRGISFVLE